jgi:hypothetical protein
MRSSHRLAATFAVLGVACAGLNAVAMAGSWSHGEEPLLAGVLLLSAAVALAMLGVGLVLLRHRGRASWVAWASVATGLAALLVTTNSWSLL